VDACLARIVRHPEANAAAEIDRLVAFQPIRTG
jgi:hypothetical protein